MSRTLAAFCLVLGSSLVSGEGIAPDRAMDFEGEGAWRTAPDLLGEFTEDELWSTRTIPFAELAGGVKLSTEHVKSAKHSLRWSDHPRYPTIHTTNVPKDWSAAKSLSLWAYSEEATGEQVTLAALSDSEATAWKDYFLYDFTVDWTEWRQLRIPLTDFEPYEQPLGWQKVDAVYFFTKIHNRQPNPYTVLHLDGMKLEREAAPSMRTPAAVEAATGRLPFVSAVPEFDPSSLNHAYPETRDGARVEAPIQYTSYFNAERALFGYYPRFQPGFVSFSPTGKAYLQYGAYIIETLGDDGKWTYQDLLTEVIEPYARETLKYEVLDLGNTGQTNDTSIRFDREGDAYMMCFLSDKTKDYRSRRCLLLHSHDSMKTWDVYELPYYMARFEKFIGHNHECRNDPPLILLSKYFAPTTNYLLIPRKRQDGTLELPEPVQVAEEAIAFIPHSGEANNALTHGDKVFLVYGQLKVLPGKTEKDGVPNYAVVYDKKTKTFSAPVLLGFGGINAKDDHNWPALAVDSKGILHVVINGHHNPFMYTHSTKPWSIDEWTEPESVAKCTSYCGLVCDKDDTLYTVSRNSDPGYYFRLSLHRKKAGQPWEAPKHLVLPFKPYYKIWYHKLVIDPATDRLFLSYYSQSKAICVFKDEYLAYVYTWPDREKAFLTQPRKEGEHRLPLGTYKRDPRKYQFYSPPATEMTILVSDDGGDTWHLATTEDFR